MLLQLTILLAVLESCLGEITVTTTSVGCSAKKYDATTWLIEQLVPLEQCIFTVTDPSKFNERPSLVSNDNRYPISVRLDTWFASVGVDLTGLNGWKDLNTLTQIEYGLIPFKLRMSSVMNTGGSANISIGAEIFGDGNVCGQLLFISQKHCDDGFQKVNIGSKQKNCLYYIQSCKDQKPKIRLTNYTEISVSTLMNVKVVKPNENPGGELEYCSN